MESNDSGPPGKMIKAQSSLANGLHSNHASSLLLDNKDVWVSGILPFVGLGNFVFVAGVCRQLKDHYLEYCSAIQQMPRVKKIGEQNRTLTRQSTVRDTFYSTVFSSLSCAKYWNNSFQARYWASSIAVCNTITKYGNCRVLVWAHQNGYPWSQDVSKIAASFGHLECLKYAHQKDCPWDEDTCGAAAYNGHLECLKYAHQNGCPWKKMTCSLAALGGHLDCLQYAHQNVCPWDDWTCYYAAKCGNMECLKYAHEHGCPWDKWTCYFAAARGQLDCLQYAHQNGCAWHQHTCVVAAKKGYLEVAKWAHENGCPWPDKELWLEESES